MGERTYIYPDVFISAYGAVSCAILETWFRKKFHGKWYLTYYSKSYEAVGEANKNMWHLEKIKSIFLERLRVDAYAFFCFSKKERHSVLDKDQTSEKDRLIQWTHRK